MPVMFCFETIIFRASAADVLGPLSATTLRIVHCCGVRLVFSNIGASRRANRLPSCKTTTMRSRSSGIAITLILGVTKPGVLSPLVQRRSCKSRRIAQLLFDAQELVVLGDAVAARRRAGLDLPRVRGHGEIGDGGILGL